MKLQTKLVILAAVVLLTGIAVYFLLKTDKTCPNNEVWNEVNKKCEPKNPGGTPSGLNCYTDCTAQKCSAGCTEKCGGGCDVGSSYVDCQCVPDHVSGPKITGLFAGLTVDRSAADGTILFTSISPVDTIKVGMKVSGGLINGAEAWATMQDQNVLDLFVAKPDGTPRLRGKVSKVSEVNRWVEIRLDDDVNMTQKLMCGVTPSCDGIVNGEVYFYSS